MSSSAGATYLLKGHGKIREKWVYTCLQLFKVHSINIRKFLLLKEGDTSSFSQLEIQFVLPKSSDTVGGLSKPDFLTTLNTELDVLDEMQYQVLSLVSA